MSSLRSLILAFVVHLLIAAPAWSGDTRRPFEVRDSVEMANFTEPATYSPDGRYLAVVTQRGVVSSGDSEATLWLLETEAIRRRIAGGPTPTAIVLARVSGAINDDGNLISRVTWEAEGRSLLFLGRDGRDGYENHRLFRVRLSNKVRTALTPPSQDVVDFVAKSRRIVYFAGPSIPAARAWWANDPTAPDIVDGVGQSLMQLLFPNYVRKERTMPTSFEVWQVRGSSAQPVTDMATGKPLELLASYLVGYMALSGDGSQLIVIAHADDIPPAWVRYEVPQGADIRRFHPDPAPGNVTAFASGAKDADYSRALQYHLIDLDRGSRRVLIDAPLADFQRGGTDVLQAAWSSDSRFVALSGTYLPIAEDNSASQRLGICAAAIVDLSARHADCLVDHPPGKAISVSGLYWDKSNRLVVENAGAPADQYDRYGAHWQLTQVHPERPPPPLDLSPHQSLDEPPTIVGRDKTSGRSLTVFDPNPQLAAIAMGSVSRYSWKDPRGRVVQGGLVKPADFSPGHPYALVIQTEGFRPRRFYRMGTSETASAGRALAGREMLVLQVDEPDPTGSWEESQQNGVDVYLAAIDQLASAGLVDPKRVGITGYSRAGMYVATSITQAPDRFAAAVIANTDPGTYTGYTAGIDYIIPESPEMHSSFIAGATPYGDGLQKWIERAPGFRTDRVRAPVLVFAADPQHLITVWDFYAALREQGKPVDLQYIRSGQHNLRKPTQIVAHQEKLVDWFDFWLNGHEDSNPAKVQEYTRWRQMREVRSASSGAAAP